MKGLSPIVAIILLVAFTVGVGGIVLTWISGLTSTQTGTVEKGGTSLAECAGAFLKIDHINSTGKVITVSNPSKNKVYTTSFSDDSGAINDTASAVQKSISSGGIVTITTGNIPTGVSTKVTVKGFCEATTGVSTNVSIEGVCLKGTGCWPS